MYILEKFNTSPLCILCTLMPQIITLLTLTLVHTWYEESNPKENIIIMLTLIILHMNEIIIIIYHPPMDKI